MKVEDQWCHSQIQRTVIPRGARNLVDTNGYFPTNLLRNKCLVVKFRKMIRSRASRISYRNLLEQVPIRPRTMSERSLTMKMPD